ncbi:sensor histidine kinase [Blastopirellula marina]|uniref:histidine kinase n=1 Tax=Blastopirellula marina TaxID=124 RepID=A0A2S8GG34_9BACT|nr:ATP-binding protein [Blastopirellula marina]PQO43412.1 two-component sensor histidine kinase [Blastopirellula marina]PTL46726.1 two-component sensor histidine kinase [Blastopirellula marina]
MSNQPSAVNDSPNQPSLEEQVETLKRRLAEAQKFTALGELMSSTTHEFNNVLTSVINYAQMGLRHKDEATRNRCFEKIMAAGERAAKITTGVLGMARNRSDRREATDLAPLVKDAVMLLEREMQKYRVELEVQIEETPPALAIGNQIQQVLLNLMINARQAMPRGGRLVVRLWYEAEERCVSLMVRDSGTGIPAEQLPRIFDPFFSTKSGPDESGKGGTGLGLATCRDIIEAHEGKIRVQSTVGVGTAFTIRLPAVNPIVPAPVIKPAVGVTPTTAT